MSTQVGRDALQLVDVLILEGDFYATFRKLLKEAHLKNAIDDKPADVLLHDGGQVESIDQVQDGLHLLVRLGHSQRHPVRNQSVGKRLASVLDQIRLLKHPGRVSAGLS